ncbi:MAG: ABC transporter ATP-binding protein [Rhodospirillaceae bacterium]|nr:MAG: ABC transporter ATP-binding protein [Rhodospirillaceae bacterium]
MTKPVLALETITKRFGATVAVDDVSLAIDGAEFVALLGPSGCGKTTLLRMIAGLEFPDQGRVWIDGRDMTAAAAYARPVNMMFQSYALFPHLSVAANVAFGLQQDGLKGAVLKERVAEALILVELQDFGARKPHQLSGGQQQRVALARCIAKRPKALLLDEPLAALDKQLRERTQLELMALQRRLGIAFVVVTHDQDEAMTMATRVAVMDGGRILQAGSPRTLYTAPETRAVAAFFGEINLWDGIVNGRTVACAALAVDLPMATHLPAGSRVAIAVRPEQITLSAPGDPPLSDGPCLAARITAVIYRGTVSTYHATFATGASVRVVRHNGGSVRSFAVGDPVRVSWPHAAILVLP